MKINQKVLDVIEYLKPLFAGDASIDEVILFGSQARGDAKEDSDVDLAIVHHDNSLRFWELRNAVRGKCDADSVDFIYTNYERIKQAEYQLDVNYWIREEGICVWKR